MRVAVEQWALPMDGHQLRIAQAGLRADQPDLVEGQTGLHANREGAGNDLEVEPALISRRDLIEAVIAVGQYAGEDVQAPGRALRVRLGADLLGQVQLLDERDEVGPV